MLPCPVCVFVCEDCVGGRMGCACSVVSALGRRCRTMSFFGVDGYCCICIQVSCSVAPARHELCRQGCFFSTVSTFRRFPRFLFSSRSSTRACAFRANRCLFCCFAQQRDWQEQPQHGVRVLFCHTSKYENVKFVLFFFFLARTSFPVLLQPVKPGHSGGGGNKCVRFTLVAAPRVKNVTYIKVRLGSVCWRGQAPLSRNWF